MFYISTRGDNEPRSFKEILLAGLAPDGGLYMPADYPQLDLAALEGKSYVEIANVVIGAFAPDIPVDDLRDIIARTYTEEIFGSPEITPLKTLEPRLHLLQLSNGPTLAFKDVALQLLGNLMEYVLEEQGETLNILGATSGDTGSAAAYALRGKQAIRLFMLSPHGRMSPFQQQQMYTLDEPNIFNLVVDGNFDDCQAMVKAANADAAFKEQYKLGAVNSINWARIAAQVVYYVYAYLEATKDGAPWVDFVVPSGNFGNALAAHVARRMGVPIRAIIVATNQNDVLHEFFDTGTYRVRKGPEVVATSSPSMDIASASNFERFVFDGCGRDGIFVRELWEELAEKDSFKAGGVIPRRSGARWRSGWASEKDVADAIQRTHSWYGVVIDPHTAVAMHIGLMNRNRVIPLVVVETAQPAKFEDAIQRALGFSPPVPEAYAGMADLPQHVTRIGPDVDQVKAFITEHVP